MANANSLFNKYSRYVAGGTTETADGKIEWWDKTIFDSDNSDIAYAVENFYEGRLDLIANVFYNESRYWWVIAQYNNILDPFNETTAGRILLIPTKERLPRLLGTKMGGVDSTRQPVNTISPVVI
jgi:hypothetical protein